MFTKHLASERKVWHVCAPPLRKLSHTITMYICASPHEPPLYTYLNVVCIWYIPLVASAVGLVGRTQWCGEGVLARHSQEGLPTCVGRPVEARKAATRRSRCETRNDTEPPPHGTRQFMRW